MIKSASLGPRSRLKLIRRDPPPVGHNCEYVKARNALILEAVKIADQKRRVSLVFSLRNGGLAGGGIEPPTRGFSVHCSAN